MITKQMFALTLGAAFSLVMPAMAGETPRADGAEVYFVNLADGDTVTSPFKVIFGLSGMGVAPAGTEKENTGHHHLLIDRPALGEGPDGPADLEYGLPVDEHHIHFGGGQTETMLELPPGQHTIQIVLGDHSHVPHADPVASAVITITVQ